MFLRLLLIKYQCSIVGLHVSFFSSFIHHILFGKCVNLFHEKPLLLDIRQCSMVLFSNFHFISHCHQNVFQPLFAMCLVCCYHHETRTIVQRFFTKQKTSLLYITYKYIYLYVSLRVCPISCTRYLCVFMLWHSVFGFQPFQTSTFDCIGSTLSCKLRYEYFCV